MQVAVKLYTHVLPRMLTLILRVFLFKCEHKSAVGFAVDFAVEKIEIVLNKLI